MKDLLLIFKALSDQNRLRIFSALMVHQELCACQLIELLQVTGATCSRHMGLLLSSGLVESRKEGRWVFYRISNTQEDLIIINKWVSDKLKDDKQFLIDQKEMIKITSMSVEDLCKKQRGDNCC